MTCKKFIWLYLKFCYICLVWRRFWCVRGRMGPEKPQSFVTETEGHFCSCGRVPLWGVVRRKLPRRWVVAVIARRRVSGRKWRRRKNELHLAQAAPTEPDRGPGTSSSMNVWWGGTWSALPRRQYSRPDYSFIKLSTGFNLFRNELRPTCSQTRWLESPNKEKLQESWGFITASFWSN